MLLRMKYWFQKPLKGFDPVPEAHAKQYAVLEYQRVSFELLDEVLAFTGGVEHKSLIDLGGGPGQYTLAFCERGANVTWHDISHNYLKIIQEKVTENKHQCNFSIGYLEDANGQYDILFNRICWHYCINDSAFTRVIFELVKKGGRGFLIINDSDYLLKSIADYPRIKKNIHLLIFWINELFDIKLAHTYPSQKKLKKVFSRLPFEQVEFIKSKGNTIVKFRK